MDTGTVLGSIAVFLALTALIVALRNRSGIGAPSGDRASFDELQVARLSIVEPNGKPRLVLANREKSPVAVIDGKQIGEPGGRPGVIFFNSDGDECGGLIFDNGTTPDGDSWSFAHLSFDQYKHDQTLVLHYRDKDGGRGVGLRVQDQPGSVTLPTQIDEWQSIDRMPDGPEKERATVQYQEKYPARLRVFIGKWPEDASSRLLLADGSGVPRLRLIVDTDGKPRIEFLDDTGTVTKTLQPD